MGVGIPSAPAERIGYSNLTSITGVGTIQATAADIRESITAVSTVTSSGQTAFKLPAAAELFRPYFVYNPSATAAIVYPPTSGSIAGAASLSLVQGQYAWFQRITSTLWIVDNGDRDPIASTVINVRDYGAVGDGVTNDQTAITAALAVAKAVHGTLYFPASFSANGFGYRGSISVTDHKGLTLLGDGYGSSTYGSKLTHIDVTTDTCEFLGTTSGDCADIYIEGIHFTGTSGKNALQIFNVIGYRINRCQCFGPTDTAGSQGGPNTDNFLYGAPALIVGIDDINITGTGPTEWSGGQISHLSGSTSQPALKIIGNAQNMSFKNVQLVGTLCDWVVTIDGLTGQTTAYGTVTFDDCHVESSYNAGNTAVNFRIGFVSPFGTVIIRGGNYFGHGNGTLYSRHCVQVYAARTVVVQGVQFTKLAAVNGYNSGCIRLESTFAGQYHFSDLDVKNSLTAYSDANAVLVSYTGDDSNYAQFQKFAPVTKTADFTVGATENDIISNRAATNTATLPAAASFIGRQIRIRTIQAQTVVSAASNVVPLAGGAAGTAILAATAGKWADLKSDGTNWQIMAGN